jgi:hypothetical protein
VSNHLLQGNHEKHKSEKKQGKQNNCDPASKITLNPASFAKQKQSATAATV